MPRSRIPSLCPLPVPGRQTWRKLWRWLRGEYRPERHYMRGASRR